jgi:hypothetical protein
MKKKTPQVDISELDTNLLQEKFCQLYASHDSEVFGNGLRCYMEVYGPSYFAKYKKQMDVKTAGVLACKALKRVKVFTRINELLEEGGFNDQNVDKQLLFVINQHADLSSKVRSIAEYNKLKKRVENKMELVLPTPILGKVFKEDKKDGLRRDNSNAQNPGSGEEN